MLRNWQQTQTKTIRSLAAPSVFFQKIYTHGNEERKTKKKAPQQLGPVYEKQITILQWHTRLDTHTRGRGRILNSRAVCVCVFLSC